MTLNYALGLESIRFQSDEFFKDLVEVVKQFQDEATKAGLTPNTAHRIFDSKAVDQLQRVISDHTGLTVVLFKPIQHLGPAIFPNFLVESHIFMRDVDPGNAYWKERVNRAFKISNTGQIKGTIDLNAAKVTGDFKKLESLLAMPQELLAFGDYYGTRVTPEESAAIILHEIGHAFIALEYMNRGTTTNQILAELASVGIATEKYNYIVSRAEANGELSKSAKDALEKARSEQEVISIVYGAGIEKSVSQLGASVFDTTACEQLADQFCVRFGAGKHLATALSKLPFTSTKKGESLRFTIYQAVFIGVIAMIPAGMVLGLGFLLYLAMVIQRNDANGTFHSRLSRIRYELVNALKQPGVNQEDRKKLLEDISVIDEALSTEEEVPYSLAERIAYLIRPGYRSAHKYERLQRELEDLAANPLFVSASKLRVAAGGKSE